MNIELLDVLKNTIHGSKCPHCKFRFKDNKKLKKQFALSHNYITHALKDYTERAFPLVKNHNSLAKRIIVIADLARLARFGYLDLCCLHHIRTSSS